MALLNPVYNPRGWAGLQQLILKWKEWEENLLSGPVQCEKQTQVFQKADSGRHSSLSGH